MHAQVFDPIAYIDYSLYYLLSLRCTDVLLQPARPDRIPCASDCGTRAGVGRRSPGPEDACAGGRRERRRRNGPGAGARGPGSHGDGPGPQPAKRTCCSKPRRTARARRRPGPWCGQRQVRRRLAPIVGNGAGVWSFLHVTDLASATVAAIEGDAVGTFNVVDDDPAPVSAWLPALAEAVGARAVSGAGVAGPLAAARAPVHPHDRCARRLERQVQARFRVAAAVRVMARRLQAGLVMDGEHGILHRGVVSQRAIADSKPQRNPVPRTCKRPMNCTRCTAPRRGARR
jgi:hypothetical protein